MMDSSHRGESYETHTRGYGPRRRDRDWTVVGGFFLAVVVAGAGLVHYVEGKFSDFSGTLKEQAVQISGLQRQFDHSESVREQRDATIDRKLDEAVKQISGMGGSLDAIAKGVKH